MIDVIFTKKIIFGGCQKGWFKVRIENSFEASKDIFNVITSCHCIKKAL